jgi:condensin complex subunit 1
MTHPYGLMHGGLLGLQGWEERYRDVMAELQKTEKALDDTLNGGADTREADKSDDERDESSSGIRSKKKKKLSR